MKRKPNVLLVVPRYETYGMPGHYVMPMGILYVSAFLKRAGTANVFTLNLNHVEGDEKAVLADAIERNDIDVFGVGGLSGEYRDMARMLRFAREIRPAMTLILGGGIVTGDPATTMTACPEADFGIIGEGELTMVELLDALAGGKDDMSDIDGLIYRKGDEFIVTGKRSEIKDLFLKAYYGK